MIDLRIEKERHMTTQDMYDVLDFAMQAAEDNGFINSFIYERALYEFAALILFPDRKEEFAPMIAENVNTAWDAMLEDGILDELVANYESDLNYLASLGKTWIDEFTTYIHSARGLLNSLQDITGKISNMSIERLMNAAKESGVEEALQIADEWGMSREMVKPQPFEVVNGAKDEDSLFSE